MTGHLVLLLSFLATPAPGQDSNWERVRSTAESQHEIIMILVDKKEYGKVVGESQTLFALPFPIAQEHRLVTSAKMISKALLDVSMIDLAQQVLNKALEAVKGKKSKAEIYREKAYLSRRAGRDDEAMKFFEKSVQLEKPDA